MTKQHKEHIQSIIKEFSEIAIKKYNKGVKEHGGNLWTKDCLLEIEPEIVDLVIYFYTLKYQILSLRDKYEESNKNNKEKV